MRGYVRCSVDGRPNRNNKVAFSNLCGIVWTRPKRVLWKLAIVKELLPGSDDRIRAAVAQVAGSRTLLIRSIKHSIPIEVRSSVDALAVHGGPSPFEELPNTEPDVINRPRRRAAINGELLRRFRS